MGLPSKRRTKSQKRRRASHFALRGRALSKCKNCGAPVLPHRACLKCGFYNGRKVLKVAAKGERQLKKREKARKKAGGDESHEGHDHA